MNMSGCCCSWLFSWSCRAQKIMSAIPRDGLKSHCDSGSTSQARVSNTRPACDPRGSFVRPAMLFGNFQIINICIAKCLEKRCRDYN